jgi:hypothetical protein
MEQGWKDLFSELNMHCAGRITLLWGSTSRQHGSGTAGGDLRQQLKHEANPAKFRCNNHAA